MRFVTLATALLVLVSNSVMAAPRVVFSGTPELRLNDFVIERTESPVTPEERARYKVVITEDNGRYFWTTRENAEMIRAESGAYVTYNATNGSGYVRVEDPQWHKLAQSKVAAYQFDYKEHLQQGLTSVTYYGKADK
jgi:hypothetical protein